MWKLRAAMVLKDHGVEGPSKQVHGDLDRIGLVVGLHQFSMEGPQVVAVLGIDGLFKQITFLGGWHRLVQQPQAAIPTGPDVVEGEPPVRHNSSVTLE